MADQEKPEPKISLPEIIGIGMVLVITDLVDLIPGMGDITDLLVGLPLQFYLYMKGVSGIPNLVDMGVEAVPIAQEMPFSRTITWGITIFMDRNQGSRAAQALQVAAELTSKTGGAGSLDIEKNALASANDTVSEAAGNAPSSATNNSSRGGLGGGTDEEGSQQKEGSSDYDSMMRSDAEVPPMEQLQKKVFSERIDDRDESNDDEDLPKAA